MDSLTAGRQQKWIRKWTARGAPSSTQTRSSKPWAGSCLRALAEMRGVPRTGSSLVEAALAFLVSYAGKRKLLRCSQCCLVMMPAAGLQPCRSRASIAHRKINCFAEGPRIVRLKSNEKRPGADLHCCQNAAASWPARSCLPRFTIPLQTVSQRAASADHRYKINTKLF